MEIPERFKTPKEEKPNGLKTFLNDLGTVAKIIGMITTAATVFLILSSL